MQNSVIRPPLVCLTKQRTLPRFPFLPQSPPSLHFEPKRRHPCTPSYCLSIYLGAIQLRAWSDQHKASTESVFNPLAIAWDRPKWTQMHQAEVTVNNISSKERHAQLVFLLELMSRATPSTERLAKQSVRQPRRYNYGLVMGLRAKSTFLWIVDSSIQMVRNGGTTRGQLRQERGTPRRPTRRRGSTLTRLDNQPVTWVRQERR